MDHSTPGLPVHHQLPEFTQTHVHRVGDAIQPSHPLLSTSPPAPNPSQHQGLFQWVNSSHIIWSTHQSQSGALYPYFCCFCVSSCFYHNDTNSFPCGLLSVGRGLEDLCKNSLYSITAALNNSPLWSVANGLLMRKMISGYFYLVLVLCSEDGFA